MSSQIDQHALYELDILRHVEGDCRLNNRLASRKLGVSIKLAHQLLTRMVEKGFLHVRKVHSRRWDYFLTPKGITEKTRLTLEFVEFSMHFYREARKRSSQVCRELAETRLRRVAFLGAGDLAEIAFLGVKEWDLSLVAVYADSGRREFLGAPVRPVTELPGCDCDAVLVCTYDAANPMRGAFLPAGTPRHDNMVWIFDETVRVSG